MDCIYIGTKFWKESGFQMSTIYRISRKNGGQFERTDWGEVERRLDAGESVHIRKASKKELALFEQVLKEGKNKK